MILSEKQALERIRKGDLPPAILVGGDNDYLSRRAFSAIRTTLLELDPSHSVEPFAEGADLCTVLDAYRTHSLFGGKRLLLVPEVHAFVGRKELSSLLDKAAADWKSAKTDRKRATAVAKFLHVLGLAALDLEQSDSAILSALGITKDDPALEELLGAVRASGKNVTRGEEDAALLAEAATRGGAPGAILLMRTGEIPRESATVAVIERHGMVVACDLTREQFDAAFRQAIEEIVVECGAKFDPAAIAEMRSRLGIERMLGDKFSREVPDLRLAVNEAERLATFVGSGGRVTAEVVRREIAEIGGGMRWELGSLFAEGKPLDAIAKLRELVAQALRDERGTEEIQYGRFLFAFADEVRQLLAIHSWARIHGADLRRSISYTRFRDTVANDLGEWLKERGLVRQKPHPFPLHKRFEAARLHAEADLIEALDRLAELEFLRKSGGVPVDIGLEAVVLGSARGRTA